MMKSLLAAAALQAAVNTGAEPTDIIDLPSDHVIVFGQGTTPNQRDGHMADIIGQHRALAADHEYVVILAGNAHAFAAPGAPWDTDFRSMVVQLEPHHPVISLRNAQSGGQAWLCTPECKVTPIAAMPEREIGIYLQPFNTDWADSPAYHGTFFYGSATVSKPLPVWLKAQRDSDHP